MELTQIPSQVINAMMAALLIGIIGPIAAAWITSAKLKTRLSPVFLGITGYILAELFLRTWFLQTISANSLRDKELLYQLVLAVSTVVFEELVRWLLVRFVYKNRATDEYACSLGVSWGAMECLITLGLVYLSYYMSAKTINAGNFTMLTEQEFSDLKATHEYISMFTGLSVILEIVKAVAGVIMQVFYTFIITRGVANKSEGFCITLASVVHLLYIYMPTLLMLLPAGLIIATLFCSVSATLLLYYMREAIRRAKYYKKPDNQI